MLDFFLFMLIYRFFGRAVLLLRLKCSRARSSRLHFAKFSIDQ